MFAIGFNGPPQSGKDTLARLFREELEKRHYLVPCIETSLSMPLRSIAYAMIQRTYPDPAVPYEEFKSTWFPQFDRTGRQLMIDVSEKFLKPEYGQEIMASMLLESVPERFPGMVLIRDTGFQIEVNPIISILGPSKLLVVQVHRPHCNFDNDSREWVKHPALDYNMVIDNRLGLDELREQAVTIVHRVEELGWTRF